MIADWSHLSVEERLARLEARAFEETSAPGTPYTPPLYGTQGGGRNISSSSNVAVSWGGAPHVIWKYPRSPEAIVRLGIPAQLRLIGDLDFIRYVTAGIIKCAMLGEQHFARAFGGFIPKSNEFGLSTLGIIPLKETIEAVQNADAMLMLIAYYDRSKGKHIKKMQFCPGSDVLPVWDTSFMELFGANIFSLPKPIIIEPCSTFSYKAWDGEGGLVELGGSEGFLGFIFAPKAQLIDGAFKPMTDEERKLEAKRREHNQEEERRYREATAKFEEEKRERESKIRELREILEAKRPRRGTI